MKKQLNNIAGFLLIAIFSTFTFVSQSQSLVELKNNKTEYFIGRHLEILEDENSACGIYEVLKSNDFKQATSDVPNLGVSSKAHWVKFTAINLSDKSDFIIQLNLATIDYLDYYAIHADGHIDSLKTGDCRPFQNREYARPDFAFKIFLNKHEKIHVVFKVSGGEQIQVPINVGEQTLMVKSFMDADLLMGIYSGIILVMILYNIFIYYSTKDKSYLFYVFYILTVGITQLNFLGYASKFFWPNSLYISNVAVYFLSSLTAIGSVEFMKRFLFTKEKVPGLHKYFILFYVLYYIAMTLSLFKMFNASYQIIQINATLAASYILFVAWKIAKQGYRPAKFFLAAWSTFLVGVCVFVFKDFGILPYNNITYYTMPIGSAFEVILLSFALADRINVLKKEKEESQYHNLMLLEENKRIIVEQNLLLESKVNERTAQLEASNKSLKEAEAHLVNAEKMASLGQLTAGISHEINNPINFVVSNVKPLKRDIADILSILDKYSEITNDKGLDEKLAKILLMKKEVDVDYVIEEINLLLKGIDEGANRTSEIVKGLKNFSRTDEAVLKKCNIHEGLDATLSILANNILSANIKVIKNYGAIPQIECYPGKLNQVFMNILNNAFHAVISKNYKNGEGSIVITTKETADNIEIRIKDNGIGIPKSHFSKIFEPFFTTKQVGMGTGLGLSIVYGIINSHKGQINILSEENEGAEFIITLPK